MNSYPSIDEQNKSTWRLKLYYALTFRHDQRVHDGFRHSIMKFGWYVVAPIFIIAGILASIFAFAPYPERIPLSSVLFQTTTTVINLQFIRLALCNLRPLSPGFFIKAFLGLTAVLTGLSLALSLPGDTFISVLSTQAVLANMLLFYGGLVASLFQGLRKWLRTLE